MDHHSILVMVVFTIVLGIAGYVAADRLRLPAIVVLMLLGILAGPEVLNLIAPSELGSALRVIVSTAVAIVVFEGGMLLDFREMRTASPEIRNLITVGVLISIAGATLVTHFVAGLPIQLAALFGALMCVTGPTVVTPLLKRANVNRRLSAILQSEAVLVDAIGAVLAVVTLEVLLDPPSQVVTQGLRGVVTRLGFGALVGLAGGFLLVGILRQLRSLSASTIRLASLGGALAVFGTAELVAGEAGITAVALAGIVLGNMEIPYGDQVKSFKGDLTNLSLVLLFILLAAGLRFDTFTAFRFGGWGGALAVVLLMVLVRPLSVMLSTVGSRLRLQERVYMSALGPRGVVAAAIATFAELELTASNYAGVESFVGLVFMTIIGTVVIEGLLATPLARRLGVTSTMVLIISADDIGRELAHRLKSSGMAVRLLDTDEARIDLAREQGLDAMRGDGTSVRDLQRAGIQNADKFVAATSSDRSNLLSCQIAIQRFGLQDVVARVNSPQNLDNFSSLGIRVVSPVVSTAILLDSLVRKSAFMELMASQVPGQEVCEVQLENKHLAGLPLRSWSLDGDVLVALVRRNGNLFVPHGDTVIEKGDTLTLIGHCDSIDSSRDLLASASARPKPREETAEAEAS